MCAVCARAIARLGAPTHGRVPFTFDEEGIDGGLLQQDQSYVASDPVPFRESPVIVHFLAGHREAVNGRHSRTESTPGV